MDHVLKSNKQRGGAREGTVSRGESPTMKMGAIEISDRNQIQGGPDRGYSERKGSSFQAATAVAAIDEAAERDKREAIQGRKEDDGERKLKKQQEGS